METMIAYCGLLCNSCPIYLATLEQDKDRQQTMRESIAELCSKHYGMKMQSGDVNDCDGCKADTGKLFSGCLNCDIRNCAILKNIVSCAFCNDYACEKLKKHFLLDSGAQTRLEEMQQTNRI